MKSTKKTPQTNNNKSKKIFFDKKIKKNLIILSFIMIFIHILGVIYQVSTNQPTLSILLKELFIVLFIIQIFLLKKEFKYTKYICYSFQITIAIISGFYSDFSSVIISLLTIFYLYNLNINLNMDIENKQNK